MSMFKLLVSKTLSRSAVCSLAFGPGISVLTEGALGSMPSKRPMLLAEAEKDRLEREAAAAKREERSLAGLLAEMRREMVRRADMVKEGQTGCGDFFPFILDFLAEQTNGSERSCAVGTGCETARQRESARGGGRRGGAGRERVCLERSSHDK